MKKIKFLFVALSLAVALSSCMTTIHTVGSGAKTGVTVAEKQWYALWGLVPINNVDSKQMAGGASDYTIKVQVKFIDYVISAFTGIVTINVQTVEVKK
jgi:PBP1b-binding outer membrane lipoprotein LpoB